MLRINLLPPYIYDKQKKIKWIVGSLALIPITLVLMLMWAQQAQAALDKENARKTEATTQQNKYNQFVQNIKKEQDAVAATKAKQTFVSNSLTYNAAWPHTYMTMRDLTSPRVLLKSLYVTDDRTGINFTGWCQKEEDLVRWWMFLRQQGDVFTNVHFRLPEHPFQPTAAGSNTGGGGLDSMGGAPMMPGMGGRPGMAGSGGMMRGGGAPMMPGMGGSGGPGAGSFGGGGSSGAVGDEVIEGRKGINFSATATLKKPLAGGIPTPTWATAGGSGGGGGGGGAPMGMGGMPMPGMSGGMMSSPGGKKGGDF